MCFTSKDEDKNNPSVAGSAIFAGPCLKKYVSKKGRPSSDRCGEAMNKCAAVLLRDVRLLPPNCEQF